MLKARDVMSKDVVTVNPDTSIEEAAKIMSENKISGLPVVESGKLVGIISEKDLIMKDKKLHFPDYINILGGIIYLESYKKFEEDFKKFIAIKVGELMTRKVVTIKPDTPIDEIASIMSDRDINRLPVLEDDRIIGIVTRADLVRNMAKG